MPSWSVPGLGSVYFKPFQSRFGRSFKSTSGFLVIFTPLWGRWNSRKFSGASLMTGGSGGYLGSSLPRVPLPWCSTATVAAPRQRGAKEWGALVPCSLSRTLPGDKIQAITAFGLEALSTICPILMLNKSRKRNVMHTLKNIKQAWPSVPVSLFFPFSLTSKIFVQCNSSINCILPKFFVYCINFGFCYLFPYWLLWHGKADTGPWCSKSGFPSCCLKLGRKSQGDQV